MADIIVLKIGGSVLTEKDNTDMVIRTSLLKKIADELSYFLRDNPNTQLILVHGAGQPGHSVAKEYDIVQGTGENPKKLFGVQKCNEAITGLHEIVMHALQQAGITAKGIPPSATIRQSNRQIIHAPLIQIQHLLEKNIIPVLYGGMVPDTQRTHSGCSGDVIAAYVAQHLHATHLLFASDIDGIFTKDPFLHADATVLPHISLSTIYAQDAVTLSSSHSTDVTDGIRGKVASFVPLLQEKSPLSYVHIFNGLKKEQYYPALAKDTSFGTIIVGNG